MVRRIKMTWEYCKNCLKITAHTAKDKTCIECGLSLKD